LFLFDVEEFFGIDELDFELIGVEIDFEFHLVFGLAADLFCLLQLLFCFT
jgi:hypothetical protein